MHPAGLDPYLLQTVGSVVLGGTTIEQTAGS